MHALDVGGPTVAPLWGLQSAVPGTLWQTCCRAVPVGHFHCTTCVMLWHEPTHCKVVTVMWCCGVRRGSRLPCRAPWTCSIS